MVLPLCCIGSLCCSFTTMLYRELVLWFYHYVVSGACAVVLPLCYIGSLCCGFTTMLYRELVL